MKLNFTKPLAIVALGFTTLTAQTGKKASKVTPDLKQDPSTQMHVKGRGCATEVPSQQWENQFQQLIVQHKLDLQKGQNVQANYTIPVVIHIIHGGQAIGTYPNLSVAQATSQVTVLNNDFAGSGLNVANYPATAFTTYATAASLPAANKDGSGRVKISNFNVNFCLATIDKNGATMATPGIDRVDYNTFTLTTGVTSKNPADVSNGDPNGDGNPAEFMTYMNNLCKPQTIWDPTKYMNIWVTDVAAAAGLLGFATFPAASSLTGVPGGTGTNTTDGLWCWGKAFGNVGTLQAPYNRGRTATHEIGHWLGLRHIWGDAACATDYCLDTPPASASNGSALTYPAKANSCTAPTGVNNTIPNGANGEMFMNYMDYVPDASMYMFTEDQRTRAQTAMANGTYRKLLGTHGLCSVGSPTPASAAFTMTNTACNGTAVSVTNNSTGNPTPTYTWSTLPVTGSMFNPSTNATSPTITFTNNGTYTVTLSAQSGTTVVSTKTNIITVSTCTAPAVCNATLTNVAANDTLYIGAAGSDTATPGCSPKAGYVYGSNCYDDLEKATFYAASKYSSITGPIVTGGVVVFYKNGTAGTTGAAATIVRLKMYNGTLASGPTGTASPVATATANLGLITATTPTNNIGYLSGDPTVTYNTAVAIPYKFTFASPVAAPAGGFFLSVTTPTAAGDTVAIFNDFNATVNTSWELWSPNGWYDMNAVWGATANMAILPTITCSTKLMSEINTLTNNVSIMPNPSNGLFNIAMTLPNTQNITISVTNTLGQTVYSNSMKSFSSGIVPVDLSNNDQGIYFITVTNGVDKNVQRVVITK